MPKALPTAVNATHAAALITNQMTVNGVRVRQSLLREFCVSHEIIAAIFTHIPNTWPAVKGKEGRRKKSLGDGRSIKNHHESLKLGLKLLTLVYTQGSTLDLVYVDLPTNFISAKTAAPP